MDFVTAKFQFEIKFTPILDFDRLYRSLLAPYIKLSSGFRIDKFQESEYITIVFEDDGVHIDCRWDRLIILTQGDHKNITSPDSITNMYFEIFDKLRQLDSFGKINNYVAIASGVSILDDVIDIEEVKKKFINYYFKTHLTDKLNSKIQPDPAIIFDFIDDNEDDSHLSIGPYDYQKDYKKRNLVPYNSNDFKSIQSSYGYMVEYKIASNKTNINMGSMNSFFRRLEYFYDIYGSDLEEISSK